MAGLSHVSAILPFMGVIAPIVIWVTQKEKSKYVYSQALQALAFQLSMILAWFIGMGCYFVSIFSTFITAILTTSSSATQSDQPLFILTFLIPMLVFVLISVGGFAFIVYGMVGAVMAFQGKPFRYILIGKWVERFLQAKPTTVEKA